MKHKTGIEEYFILKDGKKLRYGYTTGTCAAAAAKAAAKMLLSGETVEEAAIQTPKGILLRLLIEDIQQRPGRVSCAVRKDGGDDPDVTDGILIYAQVSLTEESEGISLDGGIGVGRVTKAGLSQKIGEAAINPVPGKMILNEVRQICREYNYQKGLNIIISVPEGEQIAKRTFNPRLGITGGISILGTSGIVVPMSEDALIASIRLEMKMLAEAGAQYLVITPGNYGQVFSQQEMDIDLTFSMKCSNYLGETLDMAAELGIQGILFIAHIGKFVKVSGGIMNTHSRNADCRAELLAAQAFRAGAQGKVIQNILDSVTTEEAVQILKAAGCLKETMEITAEKIQFYMDHRTRGDIKTAAIIFSNVEGRLADTKNVLELLQCIEQQRKEHRK
ncbi:cobalt-precorrin-6A synthase [uncultured Roseburia sp.]|uniref:Cobalt-precorrin-5B C(1)-methyltransferase n=1 Tax=Brotonthovivens ammoniilytica TaxID=2981725 RepID=A0ABT2TMA0_9FIRM|nr:cobalt-precorrin-5B (C(1))-methyltransferase CbiD [Brotonthovivens ammoniilytica]MCU6763357.1 cobalt-precorrin-5B (C(1))-methyltransferase CbiD [Brotonthovivens ammoniilytica]SCJ14743.1 cobalt-precorrin-6A synthase [uncultured Roseburia sp.]